ncbi:MAG TPA: glycosyltransferase [Nitrospirae bacterium]|nr:glycosyltransferase [Nitrospirota bacterium]HDZ00580.1 glycosyltransferase [Nitrospirota bacterium]
MKSFPGISIIVPAYNNPAELDQCLHSLEQSELRHQSEIIVIDDCSPGEGEAIEEAAKKYKAGFYRQAENAGPGVARNRGANEARGNILVFIDSDCLAPPGWLSGLIQPIRAGRCFATTSCYSGPVTPRWITVFQDEDYRYRMPSTECDTSFVNSCNFAIDRNVFLNCGGFPGQRISEDFVLGLMLAKRGTPARYLPDAGVLHNYYKTLHGYLRQRFSFAFNTVRSYLVRDRSGPKEASSGARSFNPVRTALGMFFSSVALISFMLAGAAAALNFDYAAALIFSGLTGLFLEGAVHGRFLLFLTKRLGLRRSVSYIFLLYLIDLVYVYAVLKALAGRVSG